MAGDVEPGVAPGELYCPTCERTFASGDRCVQDNTRLVRIAKSGDLLIGRELDGRYTIVEKLGQGGMGTVYRGTQHSVGREVAIKVVTPSLVSEGTVIKRFLREAKLASRLSHPNAVAVLDFGQTEDGLFYLVMELVLGRTLEKLVETDVLSTARLVRIGSQICDALEGAHQLHIVHRDLKPANVMVMTTGRDLVKVLDFGLAKSLMPDIGSATMTNAGALLGTPAFMPPELVSGLECDARADLYSLGCVLHYAASGKLPFVASSVHELIAMHASEPPPPLPNVPAPLARVIARLLEKDPALRYQTAALTREALEAALTGVPAVAPAIATPQPSEAPVSGPTTVLGWSGTPTRPTTAPGASRPGTSSGAIRPLTPSAAISRVTPVGAVRPLTTQESKRVVTPLHGVPADPIEAKMMASSPTLLAAPEPVRPSAIAATPIPHAIPPTPLPDATARTRTPLLLGLGALVIAAGAVIAFVALRPATSPQPAPIATPTSVPAPSPSPIAPPPVAHPATIEAAVEPGSPEPVEAKPIETNPVEAKPVAPKPVATKPKPAATKPKPVATKPKPAVTKPVVTPPAPVRTGPIRINPGAF